MVGWLALAHRDDLKAEIDMIVERARKGCEVLVRLGFADFQFYSRSSDLATDLF